MNQQPTNQNRPNGAQDTSGGGQENFDPSIFIQKNVYDAEMDDLRGRVTTVEGKVKDHTALAATLKDGFEHSKDLDIVLSAAIVKLLTTDDDTKKAFAKAVKDADREWWQKHWKKAAAVVGAIILLGIGAVLNNVAGKLFGSNQSQQPPSSQKPQ